VTEAAKLGNFVRIDMEDSSTTDDTLALYRRLRAEGFLNVGVVIQAYLKRSESDVRALAKDRANVRLCKGIYVEAPEIAYQGREEIRENFVSLLRILFEAGCYVGVATHDEFLVERSYELIDSFNVQRLGVEFQMLLGVRERLRDNIVGRGHRLRVYVPYGEQWYAYSTRRLKENPQIVSYVLKALFTGDNN
jgi:proline dehydrogenase